MKKMFMKLVPSGEVVDTLTWDGEEIAFETAKAEPAVNNRLRRGMTPAQAWDDLLAWSSNGYVRFELAVDGVTTRTWKGADVLAGLPDLPPEPGA